MKFLLSLVSLVVAIGSAQAESRTSIEGVIAFCDCSRDVDNGVVYRMFKVRNPNAARSEDEARRQAFGECKKIYAGGVESEVYFDSSSCVYSKAIRQESRAKNKEKVKFRIEKLTGDAEANLQADLMSTLNN